MTEQSNSIDPHMNDHNQQVSQDHLDIIKDHNQQISQNRLDIRQIAAQVIADFQADLEYLRER